MQRFRQDGLFYTAVLLTAVVLISLAALTFDGDGGPTRTISVVLTLGLGAALLSLVGWFALGRKAARVLDKERAARQEAESELDSHAGALHETLEQRDRLEREREALAARAEAKEEKIESLKSEKDGIARETASLEEQIQELHKERAQLTGVNSRIRDWNRQLRSRIAELQKEHGPLGDASDVPTTVLKLATMLVEAEKGLLLSRIDDDGDNDLDLLASLGFENDAEHSSIGQRFAREVIDQDTTIREDKVPDGDGPADQEIQNLVAIPIYLHDDFNGVVVCANRKDGFEELDDEVLLALGDHAGAILSNARLRGDLRNSYLATIRFIADALEAKDPFLREHSEQVSSYVAAVGDRLGLDRRRREELIFGSLLHDVGKIGISERILLKPAALTPEERTIVELHPRIGYRLVQQVPALRNIGHAILHHHERFDGSGYPQGLRGEQIPLEARIVAVADSFSAMTSDRPYRKGMSVEEACAELKRCAGDQFDPKVVRIFVEEVKKRPPLAVAESSELSVALSDAEITVHRSGDEPVLGYDSYAVTDNLTLLYSHRYFHELARAEVQRAELQSSPFSIVMIELPDIDRVNREQGYAAGDESIRRVAGAAQRASARCSGFACRYSGRRIALIVPRVGERAAGSIAREIEAELNGNPSTSCGCAEWRPGEDQHSVLARAQREASRSAIAEPT